MKFAIFLLLTLHLTSCSIFKSEKRDLQSNILASIQEKRSNFSSCIKKYDVYNQMKQDRIRVVITLAINSNGEVEKFKLDKVTYPNGLSECFFNTIDLIAFPKFKNHDLVELDQPIIFSKK